MFKYTLDIPYPSFDYLEKDDQYASLILSNLSGLHSKMNSVTLYFYNSIILQKDDIELKEAMETICKVELYHLKILAEMSYLLGADPRLWECHNDSLEYWSPGFNIYHKNIPNMLENAIIQELNTISNYTHQLDIINNDIICNVLKRIILDDQKHVEIFQKFLKLYLEKTNT